MKSIISNKTLRVIAGLIVAGVIIVSCKNDLNLKDPSHFSTDTYYQNSSQLLAGTNAIYSAFHSGALVAREWFFLHDLRSDEIAPGGGQLEIARRQIWADAERPSNAVMNSVWNGLYLVIQRANVVISNAPHVKDNQSLVKRCVAEAEFFRAWAYFELVTQWGPVPLYTSANTSPDQFQPRSSAKMIYAQIEKDLKAAATVLPKTYSSDNLGRATWGAAIAMLGRVYMQQLDFKTAKTYFQQIIDSNLYSLVDDYMDNFKKETEFNKESIFEAVFIDKGDNNFNWGYYGDGTNADQSTVRNQEYCPVAWRNLIPSDKFLANFEYAGVNGATKTDPRLHMSVYFSGDTYDHGTETLTDADQNGNSSTFQGKTMKISWRKYMLLYEQSHSDAQFHPGGDNQRIIRYAGVLLDMAECVLESSNGADINGALGYINQVRDRPSVNMPHYPTAEYPANTKMDVVKIIMHERMAELGDEEVRNIDMLRWEKEGYYKNGDPLGGSLPSYFDNANHLLLPLPQAEEDNNPDLGKNGIPKQNPGY